MQFAQVGEAETAIAKFQQYMYGGRPLGTFLLFNLLAMYCSLQTLFALFCVDVRFNDRWHTFTPSAAKGGQIAPMQAEGL